ncbi:436_t:CDS:2 [Funneliformis geosporum]|nr:436_t:CDS:2 [Funneliformis geosporum]
MEYYSKELRANFCQFLKIWLQETDSDEKLEISTSTVIISKTNRQNLMTTQSLLGESSNESILEKCKEDLEQLQ